MSYSVIGDRGFDQSRRAAETNSLGMGLVMAGFAVVMGGILVGVLLPDTKYVLEITLAIALGFGGLGIASAIKTAFRGDEPALQMAIATIVLRGVEWLYSAVKIALVFAVIFGSAFGIILACWRLFGPVSGVVAMTGGLLGIVALRVWMLIRPM